MKYLIILLLMLAAFPGHAADITPAAGDNPSQAKNSAPKSENGNTRQAGDSASRPYDGKKTKQGDRKGEEEPDCE